MWAVWPYALREPLAGELAPSYGRAYPTGGPDLEGAAAGVVDVIGGPRAAAVAEEGGGGAALLQHRAGTQRSHSNDS